MKIRWNKKISIRMIFFHLLFLSAVSPVHNIGLPMAYFPYGLICIFFAHRFSANAILFMILVLSVLLISINYHDNFVTPAFSYIIGALNIVSVLFFMKGNEDDLIQAARNVFYVSLAFGFFQYFGALGFLEGPMRVFIGNFSGSQLSTSSFAGYRGIQMLEPEPARASFKIVMLYIAAFHVRRIDVLLVVLVLIQVIAIRSATGILLFGALMLFLSVPQMMRQIHIPIIIFVGVYLAGDYILEHPKIQLAYVYYQTKGIDGAIDALALTSGGRGLAIIAGFSDLASNPLGQGLSPALFNTEDKSILSFADGYRLRQSDRPVATLLTFALTMGILPVLILLALYFKKLTGFTLLRGMRDPVFWFFLFSGCVYSAPSSPLLLVAFHLYWYRMHASGAPAPSINLTLNTPRKTQSEA